MYGLCMVIEIILLSKEVLRATKPKCCTKYLKVLGSSQRHVRAHFSGMFDATPLIILQVFGIMAEQIGAVVIGFREF